MTILLALAIAAQPQPVQLTLPPPADAVAAERAFAARAQVEGQWTAFRATAAPDAIMLAPGPINAHRFLQRFRQDPKVAVMWWPARVWTSCDGSMAVTTGPWVRRGGTSVGTFTTVWRREADGRWRWVYDNARETPRAVEAPDEPLVIPAACSGATAQADDHPHMWVQREGHMPGEWGMPMEPVPETPPVAGGVSSDGTLRWEVHRRPDHGANAYTFQVWQGSAALRANPPPPARFDPRPEVGDRLVVVEAHGFEDSRDRPQPTLPPPPSRAPGSQ